MKASENLHNLLALSAAVKCTQLPRLYFYAASNRLYRSTGAQLCQEATFEFAFGRFRVSANRGELGTIGEIFVQQPYRVFSDFVPHDGDTCLDIGANIGCVSLQWRLTNKTGRIIAVEPHPVTFAQMTANFGLNPIQAIEGVQAAVGGVDGQIEILMDAGNGSMARVAGQHLRHMKPFERTTTQSVPCITLDKLVADRNLARIDLLKIDVEGYEVECLRGALRTLSVTGRVVLEYHSENLRTECLAKLSSCGFDCETAGNLMFARKKN